MEQYSLMELRSFNHKIRWYRKQHRLNGHKVYDKTWDNRDRLRDDYKRPLYYVYYMRRRGNRRRPMIVASHLSNSMSRLMLASLESF
jgi:hypothetical protein